MLKKYFRPKPDITAYETAFLLGRIATGIGLDTPWNGVNFTEEQWADQVPDEMKRHFQDALDNPSQ